jgi:hypothetical protein
MKKGSSISALFLLFVPMLLASDAQPKGPNLPLLLGLIVIFIVIPTVFFGYFTKRK